MTLCAVYTGIIFDDPDRTPSVMFLLYVATVYGMTYGAIVYSLSFDAKRANIRHCNPAVTIAVYLMGRMKLADFFIYLACQYAGAWAATGLAPFAFPASVATGNEMRKIDISKLVLSGIELKHQLVASILVSIVFLVVLLLTFFDRSSPVIRQDDADILSRPLDAKEQKPQTQHEINCLIALSAAVAATAVVLPISPDFMNPVLAMSFSFLSAKWLLAPNLGPFAASIFAMAFGRLADLQLKWLRSVYLTHAGSRRRASSRGPGARGQADGDGSQSEHDAEP